MSHWFWNGFSRYWKCPESDESDTLVINQEEGIMYILVDVDEFDMPEKQPLDFRSAIITFRTDSRTRILRRIARYWAFRRIDMEKG